MLERTMDDSTFFHRLVRWMMTEQSNGIPLLDRIKLFLERGQDSPYKLDTQMAYVDFLRDLFDFEPGAEKAISCRFPFVTLWSVGTNRAWLVLKLETDRQLEWIFARRIEDTEHYIPVGFDPETYTIGENGEIYIDVPEASFIFPREHDRWPEMLLDEDYAVALGWIDLLLDKHAERNPVRSLLKCPHPYRFHGTQIADIIGSIRAHLNPQYK